MPYILYYQKITLSLLSPLLSLSKYFFLTVFSAETLLLLYLLYILYHIFNYDALIKTLLCWPISYYGIIIINNHVIIMQKFKFVMCVFF